MTNFTEMIMKAIQENKEIKAAVKEMLLKESAAGNNNVYVWCVKMTTVQGEDYYHPVASRKNVMAMPTLKELLDPDSYCMLWDKDQFAARREYSDILKAMKYATGKDAELIAIPEDRFNELKDALDKIINGVIGELNKCMEPLDNVAALTHRDAEALKLNLAMNVIGNLEGAMYQCINEKYEICDASEHEYVCDDEEEDCEEEEDDSDDSYEDDDCDDDEDYVYFNDDYYDDEDEEESSNQDRTPPFPF